MSISASLAASWIRVELVVLEPGPFPGRKGISFPIVNWVGSVLFCNRKMLPKLPLAILVTVQLRVHSSCQFSIRSTVDRTSSILVRGLLPFNPDTVLEKLPLSAEQQQDPS